MHSEMDFLQKSAFEKGANSENDLIDLQMFWGSYEEDTILSLFKDVPEKLEALNDYFEA